MGIVLASNKKDNKRSLHKKNKFSLHRKSIICVFTSSAITALSLKVLTVCCFCCWQDDPMTNLNTAFDVAEKYLDIPKMLDAEGEPAGRNAVEWWWGEQNFFLCSKTKIHSLRSAVQKWWKLMCLSPQNQQSDSRASCPAVWLDRWLKVWKWAELTFLLILIPTYFSLASLRSDIRSLRAKSAHE